MWSICPFQKTGRDRLAYYLISSAACATLYRYIYFNSMQCVGCVYDCTFCYGLYCVDPELIGFHCSLILKYRNRRFNHARLTVTVITLLYVLLFSFSFLSSPFLSLSLSLNSHVIHHILTRLHINTSINLLPYLSTLLIHICVCVYVYIYIYFYIYIYI